MNKIIITTTSLILASIISLALPNINQPKRPDGGLHKTASGCDPTASVIDLDINEVKARLMSGGDMWWDIPNERAAYEVPKGSKKNSLFAGSIWIGGKDHTSGTTKVAAQTYRQNGNDYWTGPLDANGGIDGTVCAEWDRFWKVNASDITKFRNIYGSETDTNLIKAAVVANQDDVPDVIKQWPGKGSRDIVNSGGSAMSYVPQREMGLFIDMNSDGVYNWRNGDYPDIVGDQYIWWIFNDKGNAKTETTSDAIGLEIHAAAFAFATSNCLNNATFYNFKVNNFSSNQLDSTYMSTWSDADLGYAFDDYVGCDTTRGLGILYNGDGFDDGATGYGYDIPMVGVDYFQGPKYHTTIGGIDTVLKLKMTVFTYYDNDFSDYGNPTALKHYYGYMTGTWKNGSPFTVSPRARTVGAPPTKYIFYGNPCTNGSWSEAQEGNTPFDRRFIHSSGPFSLVPGSEPNNIIIGAVWVPSVGGGVNACFSKIQVCDDKAQALFIDNFKLPFGPNAPKVVVQPLDKKLIFDLDNLKESNNFNEGYGTDPNSLEVINKARGYADSTYKFEGYIVYQLKNSETNIATIRNKDGSINTDVARQVFQCDKINGITSIENYESDPAVSSSQYIPKRMVDGKNLGIVHSFQLTEDAFATSTSKSLVNYKTYYYVAIAYSYNNFRQFDQNIPLDSTQDIQYLESRTDGRKSPIQIIKAMPHPATDSLYIQTYANYGTGIQLTRIEGKGNGGIAMDLSDASEKEALQAPNYQSYFPTYKPNAGPMTLKVVNPDSIRAGDYEVRFNVSDYYTTPTNDTSLGAKPTSTWTITRLATNDTIYSNSDISFYNEQYLRKYFSSVGGVTSNQLDWGLMANATQQKRPGDNPTNKENGFISSSVIYADNSLSWLTGIKDEDNKSFENWIRSGTEASTNTDASINNCSMLDWDNSINSDNTHVLKNKDQAGTFENVLEGTWAPYNLVSRENFSNCGFGLMYGDGPSTTIDRKINKLEEVYSVDIVMTSDRSLWSKCAVIEMTDSKNFTASPPAYDTITPVSEGNAYKYGLRKHASLLKDVDGNGNPMYDSGEMGMSYFPGYAINIETGERLNIMFGESSFDAENNGRDMIFNPTTKMYKYNTEINNVWGGKHIIYVARSKYDECRSFKTTMDAANLRTKFENDPTTRNAYLNMMWVGIPIVQQNFALKSYKDGLIPTETRVKIRVTRPYDWYNPDGRSNLKNGGWPLYTFNTKGIAPVPIGDAANSFTNHKEDIVKNIFAVPNPYYAVSEYENNRLDTRIRIINLPVKATINIYTLDGALIRTINKNDSKTNYVDWDLKNSKNIPIVSGMYLIHVSLPEYGVETIVKWFGAMRPLDLTSF